MGFSDPNGLADLFENMLDLRFQIALQTTRAFPFVTETCRSVNLRLSWQNPFSNSVFVRFCRVHAGIAKDGRSSYEDNRIVGVR